MNQGDTSEHRPFARKLESFGTCCEKIHHTDQAADREVAINKANVLEQELLAHELSLQGKLNMTIDRLGGKVEGKPTHEGNFLQRIDELRRIEREYRKLKRES